MLKIYIIHYTIVTSRLQAKAKKHLAIALRFYIFCSNKKSEFTRFFHAPKRLRLRTLSFLSEDGDFQRFFFKSCDSLDWLVKVRNRNLCLVTIS